MPYSRVRIPATLVGATGSLAFAMPSDFVEVVGFKATATGDTTAQIALVDADSKSIFDDAGDIDYTTAKDRVIGVDVTGTGTAGWTGVDSTGAAVTIALGQGIPARGPITVNWTNGTAGDTLALDLYVRYPLWRQSVTITTTDSDETAVMHLRQKFSQICGISSLLTGTDVLTKIRIVDADSRTVFLDAADRDYKTARVNLLLGYDDTLTGLTPQHLDGTGVAATATSASPLPVVRSPLTIGVLNGGTVTDTQEVQVYYRV